MNRLFLLLTVLFLSEQIYSQELNAQVIVNSDLVNQTNQQIFKTLERSLNEFINTQVWTNQEFLTQEKITCSFVFNLSAYSNDQFEATLQVQSQRPVFNTNYDSPVLNFLDKDIVFSYQEFQPLFFNTSSFESNLVSLISFYAYVILGLDADSFAPNGGNPYFETARQIVNLAQNTSRKGWKPSDGIRNRFWLIDGLRSNAFREYRQVLYAYHRNGLDQMTTDPVAGKQALMESIQQLEPLYQRRPDTFLIQIFFDAKVEEIVNIFTEGPKVDFKKTEVVLKKIAPFFGARWKQIKA
ncbi:DUF4835 family protein [Flavobacteriaceae bacterium]|jgi:hypothetical protein|nr:DUF4835 family protein [Flavobacteriaceae bacterium]MDA7808259.1 DUF4835 family protein [Flavobacteriaceae bacterium]MDA8877960.1 DUF4835 family protein [Flavobacteriaceae bacterium]MDA9851343.1 DUF4835 family protein [Flavobacteriaceae bacterium]MDC0386565.1 DUF4835 family protein [Flavobacteriaceae bacterium]